MMNVGDKVRVLGLLAEIVEIQTVSSGQKIFIQYLNGEGVLIGNALVVDRRDIEMVSD
jgi:hypothetical protein